MSWRRSIRVRLVGLLVFLEASVVGQTVSDPSPRFKALAYTPPPAAGTWSILDRDGANRKVDPYLSSLGQGEGGTGVITSPPFTVASRTITMTLCGHDGPRGERKKNFVALEDAETGEILRKTYAPLSDPLKLRSWDVADLGGRRVRFTAHDHDTEGAFAWLGIGRIDGGAGFEVDFRDGLPEGWTSIAEKRSARYEEIKGGVPFLSLASHESMIPKAGVAEIPCGFKTRRLFFLGCTVSRARPLEISGTLELTYREGPPEEFPLVYGYTLDGEFKLPSRSKAIRLHPSGDPFQYYFVVRPKPRVIDRIRLRSSRKAQSIPRLTAITCETAATGENLLPLPDVRPAAEEAAWIESHAIASGSSGLSEVVEDIRQAHKLALPEGPRVLTFDRVRITGRTFEAASAFDVDGDGEKDLVSGAFWYQGPAFEAAHRITEIQPAGEYWDDFSDFPLDVNGDGHPDIITGGFFGGPLRWLENPKGTTSGWKVHAIEQVGSIETTRFWDVDGDGVVEVCPNAGGNVIFFRLVTDRKGQGTGRFTRHVVKMGGCGHGLGFGDINGDGRGDFVVPDAWIEAPEDPLHDQWIWHDDGFRLGAASVPILVYDVDADGTADLIVGQAHDYGLDWYEQSVDHEGRRTWSRRRIDRGSSQYHDMTLADIDNDGRPELITGKRYRAHNGGDPGAGDPLFVRYFDIENSSFVCHTIDYGPAEKASGVGIYLWVDDVDGNGWKDIVAPGKDGLYLFRNGGRVVERADGPRSRRSR